MRILQCRSKKWVVLLLEVLVETPPEGRRASRVQGTSEIVDHVQPRPPRNPQRKPAAVWHGVVGHPLAVHVINSLA